MKAFISGQISGLAKEIYTADFRRAEDRLRRLNIRVVNPIELTKDIPEGSDWQTYMKACLKELIECDAIYMLENWQDSRGATLEHTVAKGLGLLLMYENAPRLTSIS